MADERPPPQPSGAVASATTGAADSCRTVLIIDGAYAHIGARHLVRLYECYYVEGQRIDYIKFRSVLENLVGSRLRGVHATRIARIALKSAPEPILQRSSHQGLTAQYTALKLAPPHGPQICDRFILFAGLTFTCCDGDFYDSLNLIKNVLRKDLWVVGYRNTVSADLQQLASHVIWADEVWSEIKMPATAGTIVRHHSDEDVADSDDQSTLHPQKRGKYRQVQLISQKQPPVGDRHERRDRSQLRPRNGAVQQPAVDLGNETARVVMPTAAPTTTSRAEKRLARRRGLRAAKHRRNGEPISSKEDVFGQDPRPNALPRPGILGVGPRGNGGNEAREEEEKDRKAPIAPLSFALSDVSSSEEDEAFPETKRKQITVIDLASDTESD
ncbi:hypothetical protein FI667_g3964, partial [Globisporangium splendens]